MSKRISQSFTRDEVRMLTRALHKLDYNDPEVIRQFRAENPAALMELICKIDRMWDRATYAREHELALASRPAQRGTR